MKRASRNQSGFTLLEIMMVVMIIAMLAAAAIYGMRDQLDVAGEAKVRSDLNGMKTALMMYRAKTGSYPATEQGLKALMTAPEPKPRNWTQQYTELPRDAWQSDYLYEYPAKRSKEAYDLYSAGPDKKPNTPDDIGNWTSDT